MSLMDNLRSPPLRHFTPSTSINLLFLNHPNSLSPNPISRFPLHNNNGLLSVSANTSSKITVEEKTDSNFTKLRKKIEELGVNADSCTPGLYDLFYCPMCKGGKSTHRTLSFHISQNWSYAIWRCFHKECDWAGQVFADGRQVNPGVNVNGQIVYSQPLTEESLRLRRLDDELLAFFAERMISKETLERNRVMQVAGDKNIIAFTYRRNGMIVGCKYRTIEKRFWQEKNTEKMFYGIDDVVEVDEIIIVEGELDKLSMEEAGYRNCVSVPSGAPQTVSLKDLPSLDKDTCFQYFWNCKDYLDKATRIILATDDDIPGQALAEELSRRLGRGRCWQVRWPNKDEFTSCKDPNEVLVNLGAAALREIIQKAEPYEVNNSG